MERERGQGDDPSLSPKNLLDEGGGKMAITPRFASYDFYHLLMGIKKKRILMTFWVSLQVTVLFKSEYIFVRLGGNCFRMFCALDI